MRVRKNFHFPICARPLWNREDQLVGTEKLSFLATMTAMDKNQQYLFFYNFLNQRNLKQIRNRWLPYYTKTQTRSPSTTFVIDFDELQPTQLALLDEGFENLKKVCNNKCLMVNSPSGKGRHIIYVINGVVKEDLYARIQKCVIRECFTHLGSYVDFGSSCSIHRGFFHSQHLIEWIQSGLVNTTFSFAAKKSTKHFWDKKIRMNVKEYFDFLNNIHPINSRKVHELIYDGQLLIKIISNGEEDGFFQQEAKKIYSEICSKENGYYKEKAESIFTGYDVRGAIKAFIRDENSQCQTKNKDFTKQTRNPEGQSYRSEQSDKRSGNDSEKNRDSGNQRNLSSDSAEFYQRCEEGVLRDRYTSDFSYEFISWNIEKLYATFTERNISIERVVYDLRLNIKRSYYTTHQYAEERSFDASIQSVYSHLESITGQRDISESLLGSFALWLRFSTRVFRSQQIYNQQYKILKDTAWLVNYYIQKKLPNQYKNLENAPNYDSQFINRELCERFIKLVEEWMPTVFNKINKEGRQCLLKIFKDREWLIKGVKALLSFLQKHFKIIKDEKLLNIGLEDFQAFFNTHVKKASLLRKVFCGYLAKDKDGYIPHVKCNGYIIDQNILAVIYNTDIFPSSYEKLAPMLGNGNTWKTIQKYLSVMKQNLDIDFVEKLWYTSIEISCANEKELRKKNISNYLRKT